MFDDQAVARLDFDDDGALVGRELVDEAEVSEFLRLRDLVSSLAGTLRGVRRRPLILTLCAVSAATWPGRSASCVAAGRSGKVLADRTRMSQSAISRIETARATPTAADVERILHALDADEQTRAEIVACPRSSHLVHQRAHFRAGVVGAVDRRRAITVLQHS